MTGRVLKVWVTAIAVVGVGALAGGRASAVPPTEVCEQETYVWTGSGTVGGGSDRIDTGIVVAPQLGSTLRVVGTSADGLDSAGYAISLPVSVGDVPASAGAVVPGGAVRIHSSGPAVTVNGATVVVERCALVAVAPIPQLPAGQLPETGSDTAWWALGAALLTAAGIALVLISRRVTAGDRGPGSPRAALPPSQG